MLNLNRFPKLAVSISFQVSRCVLNMNPNTITCLFNTSRRFLALSSSTWTSAGSCKVLPSRNPSLIRRRKYDLEKKNTSNAILEQCPYGAFLEHESLVGTCFSHPHLILDLSFEFGHITVISWITLTVSTGQLEKIEGTRVVKFILKSWHRRQISLLHLATSRVHPLHP